MKSESHLSTDGLARQAGNFSLAMRSGFFHPWEEDKVSQITVELWLYGALAPYGGEAQQGSFANLRLQLPEQSTVSDLLAHLRLPTEERGITFINGQLSAMPGLQPDLGHLLADGDRVAFFDLRSMWPFQYRHGAMMIPEMSQALDAQPDQGLHHAYDVGDKGRTPSAE